MNATNSRVESAVVLREEALMHREQALVLRAGTAGTRLPSLQRSRSQLVVDTSRRSAAPDSQSVAWCAQASADVAAAGISSRAAQSQCAKSSSGRCFQVGQCHATGQALTHRSSGRPTAAAELIR